MKAEVKSEVIKERISKVRRIMEKEGVDVYLIATGDYHISEYAGDYFKEREYITGFTGSAGTAVITMKEAVLFTDGRYFVQAEKELENTGIKLMRMGVLGVMTLLEYIVSVTDNNKTLGFDGRTVPAELGIELVDTLCNKKDDVKIRYDFNAAGAIFEGRAPFPNGKAFYLDEKYSGRTIDYKLSKTREQLKYYKATCQVLSTLDDICYLYNIRGCDVKCNPVIMAYSLIWMDKAVIYTDSQRFDDYTISKLDEAGVIVAPYEDFYEDLKKLSNENVLFDLKRNNMSIYNYLCENKSIKTINKDNPQVLMKAVKNSVEIDNLKAVHYEDGAKLTEFIFWLKENVAKKEITEAYAAKKLDLLRGEIEDFIEPSFDTISAYNENAAMMHYHATEENSYVIKPEGMLLVDSGGQYLRGTTDVTRTIALGPVTEEMKKYYTLTLKGMLALADAHFLRGCTGYNLDILARSPLWEAGMDYRCGTGHGVGYLLNVHESPNGFRWKHNPGKNDLAVIEPGMVTSDEPGVYIEGQFGIRIENEIVCVKDYENEYGEFLKFEMLTAVPLELELIDTAYLDKKDVDRLNNYHTWVREKLMPYFDDAKKQMLIDATRTIM